MSERRSRMRRVSNGKKVVLTRRDLEIFRALALYRDLRSTYLHAFAGGASETRFKERLGNLFHEGYLDRPAEQWRSGNGLYQPVIHELGKNMRRALAVQGIGVGEERTWFRDTPHRQFDHSLMVCEILASIELGIRERSGLRLIPWPEILAKAPETARQADCPYQLSAGYGLASVTPDAIFGIEYQRDGQKAYRFFALEADRGTMPIARAARTGTSVLSKLAAIPRHLAREVHRDRLGIPNLLVLTATTGQVRCTELVRRFGERVGHEPQFLFSAAGTGPTGVCPASPSVAF